MKVLNKLGPPGVIHRIALGVQACFALIGNSVLYKTVAWIVSLELGSYVTLPCGVRVVKGVLCRISESLKGSVDVVRV